MKTNALSKTTGIVCLAATLLLTTACDKSSGGVAILSAEENFKVSLDMQPRPVDIMWVIDNSGSMSSSQTNLANNFNSFIQDFVTLKYDFRMVTTTTDSWLSQYNSNAFYSPRWRKGNRASLYNPSTYPQGANTDSGVFVMTKDTPGINSVFTTNAKVGTQGDGDERGFASMIRSLDHAANNDFRRNGAFLAVVIVSDEEDFSRTDNTMSESYTSPKLLSVDHFVGLMDARTGSTAANRKDNYQVNAIYIKDAACLNLLNDSAQKISTRYGQMADITGGAKGSLCDPFNTVLNNIKNKILVASAVFKLDREPIESSIVVKVNGVVLAQGSTTWTYTASDKTIRFAEQSVPAADANISITYDPKTLL